MPPLPKKSARPRKPSLKSHDASATNSFTVGVGDPKKKPSSVPQYMEVLSNSLGQHYAAGDVLVVKYARDNKPQSLIPVSDNIFPDPVQGKIRKIYEHPLQSGIPLIGIWTDGKPYSCTLDSVHSGKLATDGRARFLKTLTPTNSSKRKASSSDENRQKKKKAADIAAEEDEDRSPRSHETLSQTSQSSIVLRSLMNSSQSSGKSVQETCLGSETPDVPKSVPVRSGSNVVTTKKSGRKDALQDVKMNSSAPTIPTKDPKLLNITPGSGWTCAKKPGDESVREVQGINSSDDVRSSAPSSTVNLNVFSGKRLVDSRTALDGRPTYRLIVTAEDHLFPFEMDGKTKQLLAPELLTPPIFIDVGFLKLLESYEASKGSMIRDVVKRLLGITSRNMVGGRILYNIYQQSLKTGQKPPGIAGLLGDDLIMALKGFAKQRGFNPNGEWITKSLNGWKDEMFAKFRKQDAVQAAVPAAHGKLAIQ